MRGEYLGPALLAEVVDEIVGAVQAAVGRGGLNSTCRDARQPGMSKLLAPLDFR